MINRLRELQASEASSHFIPTQTAQNLPQVSQDEAHRTSGVTTKQQSKTKQEDTGEEDEGKEKDEESSSSSASKVKPQLPSCSTQRKDGSSSPTCQLPDSPYPPGRADSASKKMEATQGEGGGGGAKRQTVKENGRKAKQKLNFPLSSRRSEEEEEEGRAETNKQPPSSWSWSEMSSILIGSDYCLSPLSPAMEQRLILQYLTPLGEYQEVRVLITESDLKQHRKSFHYKHLILPSLQLLAVFMKLDTRSLLMNYIELRKTKHVQLTFDALLVRLNLFTNNLFSFFI